jgi:hypothetical protein
MLRIQNLCALTTIGLLALGLVASQFKSATGFTIQIGAQNRGYGFSIEMPLYCIGALFAVLAFLYSIGYIPFSSAMTRWHFWLSLVSAIVCLTGAAIFYWYASRMPDTTDTKLGLGGTLLAASYAAGLVTFVSMQLWFTVDLARALWKMYAA